MFTIGLTLTTTTWRRPNPCLSAQSTSAITSTLMAVSLEAAAPAPSISITRKLVKGISTRPYLLSSPPTRLWILAVTWLCRSQTTIPKVRQTSSRAEGTVHHPDQRHKDRRSLGSVPQAAQLPSRLIGRWPPPAP